MKPGKVVHIKQKLADVGTVLEELSLGDFTYIGEPTARKMRDPGSPLWKAKGSHFSPNLERGLLIHELIKRNNLSTYLEIGFGRGYSALCAAKALHELGGDGTVMVIEPNIDQQHMDFLSQIFPAEWTKRIQIARARSDEALPQMRDQYDLVYVDGDHTQAAVRSDYEGVKDLFGSFCLFDDYHLERGTDAAIQVSEAFDDVELPEGVSSELIVMDRRVFVDDRGWPDDRIRYGQLLLTRDQGSRPKVKVASETWDW